MFKALHEYNKSNKQLVLTSLELGKCTGTRDEQLCLLARNIKRCNYHLLHFVVYVSFLYAWLILVSFFYLF